MSDRCHLCGYPKNADGLYVCGHPQTAPAEQIAEIENAIAADVDANLRALWARSIVNGGQDATAADIQQSVSSNTGDPDDFYS